MKWIDKLDGNVIVCDAEGTEKDHISNSIDGWRRIQRYCGTIAGNSFRIAALQEGLILVHSDMCE